MIHQFTIPEAFAILAFDLYLYFLIYLFIHDCLRHRRCRVANEGEWQNLLYVQSGKPIWTGLLVLLASWSGLFCWQTGILMASYSFFVFAIILLVLTCISMKHFDKPKVQGLKLRYSEWRPGARITVRYNIPELRSVKFVCCYIYYWFLDDRYDVSIAIKEMKDVKAGLGEFEFTWPEDKNGKDWTLKIVLFKTSGPAHVECFEIPRKSSSCVPEFLRPLLSCNLFATTQKGKSRNE